MKDNKRFVEDIANMQEDFPQWYTDVVLKTQLVDYGPVKGSMVIRPYGYGIWENIQNELNKRFKAKGVENAYFPMLIPYSLLQKEADHVEGFSPEVALVTHAGGEKLAEPLVVRPTSETIICDMFSKWVKSYRDLPMKLNQWANVVRWEKTTRPFLRTSEFLWQEGHTLHASKEEAEQLTLDMLNVYKEFAENVLAMPVFIGKKTESEKFAGADATYGMEAMMLDGKSLQAGTSHFFGQKFSKAYDIQYLDSDGSHKHAWQTSWGVSTRLIGGLIMTHGDQRGLAIPPKVAPIQVVIVPIMPKKDGVLQKCEDVFADLEKAGIRVKTDNSDQTTGWKFNEWEMKGVPVRLEVGPRDIENGGVTAFRRDTLEKTFVSFNNLAQDINNLLQDIQKNMLEKARAFRDSNVVVAKNFEELKQGIENKKFVKVMWNGKAESEAFVKEQLKATSRVMPLDQVPFDTKCAITGEESDNLKVIYFARAY